jgi:hypothetical protein
MLQMIHPPCELKDPTPEATEKQNHKHRLRYPRLPSGGRDASDIAQSRESWTCSSGKREQQQCHPESQALKLEQEPKMM